MISRVGWRAVFALAAGAIAILVPASPAAAHTAVPTDVRTAIIAIRPSTSEIQVALVGGGAFMRLRVDHGTTVTVIGYQGEPYVRVDTNGTVEENTRSPAVYLNRSRYGSSPVPASADAKAQPQWRRVGAGGVYVWHDHRTHWMAASEPPRPVDWTVPLVVNGHNVTVLGRYEGMPTPSSLPWLGALLAALVLTVALGWRHAKVTAFAVLVAATAGLPVAIGLTRVPVDGTSNWVGVVLCAFGICAAAIAIARSRSAMAGLVIAAAGLGLAAWASQRVDVLGHAVLVTTLPGWLDRLSVTLGIGVGLAALFVGPAGGIRTTPGPERQDASASRADLASDQAMSRQPDANT